MKLREGEVIYDVATRATRDGVEATVGGARLQLRVTEVGPGVFVVAEGATREIVHCVREGAFVHVFADGVVHVLEQMREGAPSTTRSPTAGVLEAPMPGKVVAVKVAEGDAVRRGQELLVVEAMKMENALRAPRDGRVARVHTRVGDMVTPGRVLVEME